MKETAPIGVFDSGLGGLTVLRELQSLLPHENFIFVGDSANAPYGSKTPSELQQMFSQFMNYFQERDVKMAVCACNTMTSYLQDKATMVDFPIIWMDPSVDTAIAKSQTKKIAVIATQATVNSKMHQRAAQAIYPEISIHSIACPEFVPVIESAHLESGELTAAIHNYLGQIPWDQVDSVILGCTHYPIILEQLIRQAPPHVHFINPAENTAHMAAEYLLKHDLKNSQKTPGQTEYYFSAFSPTTMELVRMIMPQTDITDIKLNYLDLNTYTK